MGATEQGSRRGARLRWIVIAVYLIVLATSPRVAFLGLGAAATAGAASLSEDEASRFRAVSWETLGGFPYEFAPPGSLRAATPAELEKRNEEILPASVRTLDGAAVAIRGFVIPLTIRKGRVSEFVLAAKNDIGCCFGDGLAMNQWIVTSVEPGQEFPMKDFMEATALGRLSVGEEIKEGTVFSLYRLRASRIRTH